MSSTTQRKASFSDSWVSYRVSYRVAELYEYALQPEHLTSVDPHIYPTTIADSGALSVSSGQKTGRVPKDKRVVLDETTKDVRFKLNATYQLGSEANPYLVDHLVGQREHPNLS